MPHQMRLSTALALVLLWMVIDALPTELLGWLPFVDVQSQGYVARVEIQGAALDPQSITIPAGATVYWTSPEADVIHNITFKDLPGGPVSRAGTTVEYSFPAPGNYRYVCTFHPSIRGQVIVTPPGLPNLTLWVGVQQRPAIGTPG